MKIELCILLLYAVYKGTYGLISSENDIINDFKKDDEFRDNFINDIKPIVCYFTWTGNTGLTPNKIDPNLCSHIILGFFSVEDNVVQIDNSTELALRETVNLKQTVPDLKIMFSIAGGMSPAVQNSHNRSILITSILKTIDQFSLDGLDVDWEFPSWFAPIEDKTNFVLFMKEFRKAADASRKGILFSVAVTAITNIIDTSYNPEAIARYPDFINLMSYGFHDFKPFEDPFTGFNSPLYPRAIEKAYFATLNMDYSADYWIKLGVPKAKLYPGLPVYAHTYTLALPYMNGVDAPAVAGGVDWSYSQVCKFLKAGAIRQFDNESLVPYAYMDLDWISYDDEESLTYKAKWLQSKGYGGAMIFNLNSDDWVDACGTVKYPLIKLIKNIFDGNKMKV